MDLIQSRKVMHIVPSLRRGGAERFVVDLCNALVDKADCIVYLISLADNTAEDTFINDLRPEVRYRSYSKKSGFDPKVFLRLNKMLHWEKPTIVHTHTNAFEYVLLFRLWSQACSFFHTIHSKAEKECPSKIIKWLRRYFYKRNTTPITISKDGRSSFINYYKLTNDVLIENGRLATLPTYEFPSLEIQYKDRNKFLLIHIGRVIEVKNQQLLIEAVQLFNKRSEKKCKLLLIGGIRDERLYESLLVLSHGDSDIVFLGDKHNVGDYLLMGDAFCLSSKHEGMPISIIEAFSVACIPVCTPVGGIPEMVNDGENGFLSTDMSVEAYYQALNKCLYADNEEILRQNCLHIFKEKYDIGICAQKYIRAYHII